MSKVLFLLGVRIHLFSQKEICSKIRHFLHTESQHRIFTPNPEMIVATQSDPHFRKILNSSSLNLCDGAGISLVARMKGIHIARYAGVDCMLDMCGIASQEGKSVYLLGSGDDHVIDKTKLALKKKFSLLKIVGANKGPHIEMIHGHLVINTVEKEEIVRDIQSTNPDILFVAFGQKKQEYWIANNLAQCPCIKIAMGVGGAFDFLSGKVKRAPQWLRKIDLEWLWRLAHQPWRVFRIWNATISFLWICAIKRKKIYLLDEHLKKRYSDKAS